MDWGSGRYLLSGRANLLVLWTRWRVNQGTDSGGKDLFGRLMDYARDLGGVVIRFWRISVFEEAAVLVDSTAGM